MKRAQIVAVGLLTALWGSGWHGSTTSAPCAAAEQQQPKIPRIIFSSPRAIAFQLRRLSNEQLLLVERDTTDPKYIPVYEAMLSRPGLRPQYRQEAVDGLASLHGTEPVAEVIAGIRRMDKQAGDDKSVLHELATMLQRFPREQLRAHRADLEAMIATGERPLTRRIVYASWVHAEGDVDTVWQAAGRQPTGYVDLIDALPLIADIALREPFFGRLEAFIAGEPHSEVGEAAIRALGHIPGHEKETFATLAGLIEQGTAPAAAIFSIRNTDQSAWPPDELERLLRGTLRFARSVPIEERSTPVFLEAMHLAEDLASRLPADRRAGVLQELRSMSVASFLIKTIPNEMRYDRTQMAVEAGKLASITFENNDTMLHNLVVTKPGSCSVIGRAAEAMVGQPEAFTKGFVPDSDDVLWATKLLQPGENAVLSFEAPREPGVYPFVCTYPGHWRRMYGALYVVADLQAYEADPVAYLEQHPLSIEDELLKNDVPRTEWTFEELESSLDMLAHGRSHQKAQRVFQFANCVACHRLNGVGKAVGPDLAKLDPNWTSRDVLLELLEPSRRINEDFQTYTFQLNTGRVVRGMIVEETDRHVKVLEDPLAIPEPVLLSKTAIETREKSAASIMPRGLLDKLTTNEILDLIAYVMSRGDPQGELFQGAHHHD